ncbi:hypothetical protein FRC10_005388 [Ceratobasidium sp. 414]|nr:hypothetical protein FRC10_005388 [Ceratobasidium sp. 414]
MQSARDEGNTEDILDGNSEEQLGHQSTSQHPSATCNCLACLVTKTPDLTRLMEELEGNVPKIQSEELRADRTISLLEQIVSLLPQDAHELRVENLSLLGDAYLDQFTRLGTCEDLDKAIECRSKVISLSPDEDVDQPRRLGSLGGLHHTRFLRLGELTDLDKAIECMSHAVSLTPVGHVDRPVRLVSLGGLHNMRFLRLGEFVDADKAVECHTQAVSLTPEGHADKAGRLGSLGGSYHTRFLCLGELIDINRAIEYWSQAVSLTPDGHADKPRRLGALGVSHWNRFNLLGELADIDRAIDYKNQALSLTPNGHTNKPSRLNNLGNSHLSRFKRLGELTDLDAAITFQRQAVSSAPDGRACQPSWLSNLGCSYLTRFECLGEFADLNSAIDLESQAVSLIPHGHKDKPAMLNNLGVSYDIRFRRLGDLADVDEAISLKTLAVSLIPERHADKPGWLGNLGNSHLNRFERLGELADLDKAIEHHSQAESLTLDDHVDKPIRLNCLGNSYLSRFECQGDLADIDKAIECMSRAVAAVPDGHTSRPRWLGHLGVSYLRRFEHLGKLADINMAIERKTEAVSLTPDEHVEKPLLLNNLGNSCLSRFEHLGELADIDKAIECQKHAVSLCPNEDAYWPRWLNNLGFSYRRRFKFTGSPEDIKQSIPCFKAAAQSPAGHPLAKLEAALCWARLSIQHDMSSSLEAYARVMSLIPEVVWLGAAVGRRYERIKSEIGNVVTEAAEVAIGMREYSQALEWLEDGRFIIWNQLLQLRTPLDKLVTAAPLLAAELQQVARDLDLAAALKPVEAVLSLGTPPEEVSQNHRRLAERWQYLINQVQLLPGFQDFMRPQKAFQLGDLTRAGAVVVINVGPKRCDALALLPGRSDTTHIPLNNFSHKNATQARAQLVASLHAPEHDLRRKKGDPAKSFKQEPTTLRPWAAELVDDSPHTERGPVYFPKGEGEKFSTVLAMLWVDVVKPVLEGIGYLNHSSVAGDLPHITWCTTGPLSFLPLHAAGCYEEPGPRVFDYITSSYTPTLSALANSAHLSTEFRGILAVGQADTLPETVAELDQIQKLVEYVPFTRLDGHDATPPAVLAAMEEHSWIHLACHASQSMCDPTKSAFHLHGGELDLAMLASKPFKHAELAFLSACETAAGDEELPEEAVHLAAGMLVAGYSAVIATMWSIKDNDAPLVAKEIYAQLLEGGVPNSRKAAKALHSAVAGLRGKVGEQNFARWVPFIHIGS